MSTSSGTSLIFSFLNFAHGELWQTLLHFFTFTNLTISQSQNHTDKKLLDEPISNHVERNPPSIRSS